MNSEALYLHTFFVLKFFFSHCKNKVVNRNWSDEKPQTYLHRKKVNQHLDF